MVQTLESIERLKDIDASVLPDDTMSEAGRKILLQNFREMLDHEAGCIQGQDMEAVHQMRVATRRMRSAFILFEDYYKSKPIRPFRRRLKIVARALGRVRDLDVMIDNLKRYQSKLDQTDQSALEGVIGGLADRRENVQRKLTTLLQSKLYRDFVSVFSVFLATPGKGSAAVLEDGAISPHQVRHVVPMMVHQQLAAVRAYDTGLPTDNVDTLHALRIEFKRLRYTITFFSSVMGGSVDEFINELKSMQDYLGHLNDAVVAHHWLDSLSKLEENQQTVLHTYMAQLEEDVQRRVEEFPEVWTHFNTRSVQRKLSDSLLALR